jgi:hypothetical protein
VQENSKDFLISEFEFMAESKRHLATYSLGLLSLVLTLATTTTAGLVVFVAEANPSNVEALVAVALGAALNLVAAWPAAQRGHDLLFQARVYSRGLNSIRFYFAEQDNDIGRSLVMPTDPKYPPYFRLGPGKGRNPWMGPAGQSLAIAVVAAGVLAGCLVALLLESLGYDYPLVVFVVGLVTAAASARLAHLEAIKMSLAVEEEVERYISDTHERLGLVPQAEHGS